MTDRSAKPLRVLQSHHFIKIQEGKIFFWDYKQHKQFEISAKHLERLVDFSEPIAPAETAIDFDLMTSGVLVAPSKTENWQWDWLSHIFHHGTSHPLPNSGGKVSQTALEYARSYADFCESIKSSTPDPEILKGGKTISLPEPCMDTLNASSFWETLKLRRTCREFDGGPVALQTIADLLFVTFGDQKVIENNPPANMQHYGYRRTSPSAGGLQAIEPYLWVLNIEGLPPGIYHYLSCRHQLEIVQENLPESLLGEYLCHQDWADDMAFAVIMTARFDKMWWKYPHSRAYRPMLMDIGHLSQTLCLGITAYGLQPWLTGYFHDQALTDILQCTPDVEFPIFLVGGGSGTGSSYDRETRALAASRGAKS